MTVVRTWPTHKRNHEVGRLLRGCRQRSGNSQFGLSPRQEQCQGFCQVDPWKGASAINCWCPVPNRPTCYSLGRHLSAPVLSSTRPMHREETTLSQPRVFVARKRRVQTHHPLRILQNHSRKTTSLPMRRMRTDVLVNKGHPLLPLPAPENDVRHGRHAEG